MTTRKCIAGIVGGLALLTLGACGSTAAGTPNPAPSAPAPTPPATSEQDPPLPIPETDDWRSPVDRAYLSVLDDEGIDLDDDRALELADLVCDTVDSGGAIVDAVDVVLRNSTLGADDAGYVGGAAYAACPTGGDI